MIDQIKTELWNQFGASIDTLAQVIEVCPDDFWDTEEQFWYLAFHTLFFMDYYLSNEPEQFLAPEPFGMTEMDPSGARPERSYTKHELLEYLSKNRAKAKSILDQFTLQSMEERFINPWRNFSKFEIYLYNMRHIQHHAAQLNMLLRKHRNTAAAWVNRAT